MRQAIITKYLGPTNTRGTKVVAKSEAGSVVLPWDYSKGPEANHQAAASLLAWRLGWDGTWQGGSTPTGYVFTWACDADGFTVPAKSEGA